MKKSLILTFGILSMLLIFSCKDGMPDDNMMMEDSDPKLPDYFVRNDDVHLKIEHFADGTISRLSWHPNEFMFSNDQWEREIQFNYDINGLPSSSTFYADGWGNAIEAEYHYTDDQLDSIISSQFGQAEFRFVLNYATNGLCEPKDSDYCEKDEDSNILSTEAIRKVFFDETCQHFQQTTISNSFSGIDTTVHNIEIEYDSEINYWPTRFLFSNVNHLEYAIRPANNIRSYMVRNTNGDLESNSFTSEYEYSAAGQITSEVRTFESGNVQTFEFFYK